MVKSHLTLAVKEEIVALKNQIKQLNELCTRLEQENQILRQHATPETLKTIENRGVTSNQGFANAVASHSSISNISTNSLSSSTQQPTDSSNIASPLINNTNSVTNTTANITNNNSNIIEPRNNTLPVVDHSQDNMISSFTEHVIINNGEILSNLQSSSIDPSQQ